MEQESRGRTSRRRRARDGGGEAPRREVNYRQLRNPFPQMAVFSDDQVAAMHDAALQMLEELGIKVLLPEARKIFARAGARVDESSQMVYLGRDIIAEALSTAPKSITARAATRERDLLLELGSLTFQCGAGAPHATDLERGRRPGTGRDFREFTRIVQHYDVLHMMPPVVEPQDIATNVRHYFTMEAQLSLSDKLPFVFSRGTPQVTESFELLANFRGLTDDAFRKDPHCYTIINTNSPRVLDIPMAQGLIDFARHRQLAIVTPFTLMGAMAPITVAGAITLSHAEALAAIALTQLTNPGAPVMYGTFTSNVDMKSGAPAFGTPEYMRATQMTGQLARFYKLPMRASGVCAANVPDGQAMWETSNSLWSGVQAGAHMIYHAAGWLEGGLIASPEKFVMDCEVLQQIQRYMEPEIFATGEDEIALDAIRSVGNAGHFFGIQHTQDRYTTAFYQPFLSDWKNFEGWEAAGAVWTPERAHHLFKEIIGSFEPPPMDIAIRDELAEFVERRKAEGGAPTDF